MKVRVYGRVQRVFFRASAKNKALELGLKGWVRNREDGTVELMAQGSKGKMQNFLDWCRKGPGAARVDNVKTEEIKSEEIFSGFRIRY